MAQRKINAKWCQYDVKDIKCHFGVAVFDVLSVVIASTILAPPDLHRLMCHIGTTWLSHLGTTWPSTFYVLY